MSAYLNEAANLARAAGAKVTGEPRKAWATILVTREFQVGLGRDWTEHTLTVEAMATRDADGFNLGPVSVLNPRWSFDALTEEEQSRAYDALYEALWKAEELSQRRLSP